MAVSKTNFALSEKDWERLHALQFVDQPGCWNTCGGGFCCTMDNPRVQFKLMKPGAAGMVFFDDEYRFLENRGVLQGGFAEKSRRWRFAFDNDLELSFVTSICALKGKCTIPNYRPLLCKIYPFFPRIDLETLEVTGHINASVIDQLWSGMGVPDFCTLAREKPDVVKAQMQPGVEILKEYPYVLFYIKATEIFLDDVAEQFKKLKLTYPQLTNAQLFSRWEILYLAGRAFDQQGIREKLKDQYARLRKRFSDFDLRLFGKPPVLDN